MTAVLAVMPTNGLPIRPRRWLLPVSRGCTDTGRTGLSIERWPSDAPFAGQPVRLLDEWLSMSKDPIQCDDVMGFRVPVGGTNVLAYISRSTCQAADSQTGTRLGMSEFLRANRPTLEQIVVNKIRAGARPPVMVMARDLWPHHPPQTKRADNWTRHQ